MKPSVLRNALMRSLLSAPVFWTFISVTSASASIRSTTAAAFASPVGRRRRDGRRIPAAPSTPWRKPLSSTMSGLFERRRIRENPCPSAAAAHPRAARVRGRSARDGHEKEEADNDGGVVVGRRLFLLAAVAPLVAVSIPSTALAAPPFAIMAEEMGYFPVKDERTGDTIMVPSRVNRKSTDQALALADYLNKTGARMYGAFWCPHCSRQKETFGSGAWSNVPYVECSPKGYKSEPARCLAEEGVEGYPTWKFGNGEIRSGEMDLVDIATVSGYLSNNGKGGGSVGRVGKRKFNPSLEKGVPQLGGSACK